MFIKIIVLSEFENSGIKYGLYWAHYKSPVQDKWILIARNGENIQIYSHYHDKKPQECFDDLQDKVKKEFLYNLDHCIGVVNLSDFTN